MQKFNTLKSVPAYLPIVNIDTDMIIPKQFLKTIKRTGLGKNLFFEMRYDDQGKEISDFVLNQSPYNDSKILIAGKNFGCGSSREHAPWALLDFGITCVISSSYADIFYSNCFKNGILPIILKEEKIKELSEYAGRKEEISVDLNDEKMVFALLESYQLGKHQYYSLLNSLMKSIETYKNPEIKPMLIEVATTDGFPKAIRVKAIKSLLKFNDPEVAKDLVAVLESPSNYIFYSEIIKMMKDLGVYETYKDEIRSSAFKAMKKDILN